MPVKSKVMLVVQCFSWESPVDVFAFAWNNPKASFAKELDRVGLLIILSMHHNSDGLFTSESQTSQKQKDEKVF